MCEIEYSKATEFELSNLIKQNSNRLNKKTGTTGYRRWYIDQKATVFKSGPCCNQLKIGRKLVENKLKMTT